MFVLILSEIITQLLGLIRSRISKWEDTWWSVVLINTPALSGVLLVILAWTKEAFPLSLAAVGVSLLASKFRELLFVVQLWKKQRLNREIPNAEVEKLLKHPRRRYSIVFLGLSFPLITSALLLATNSSSVCLVLHAVGAVTLLSGVSYVALELRVWSRIDPCDRHFNELPLFVTPEKLTVTL
jgi:hypothetical protein